MTSETQKCITLESEHYYLNLQELQCNHSSLFYRILLHLQGSRFDIGRSQWRRGLRHEMSSPALTLGSWVRIPLEAWMFAFILCLCCPV
jgi:hypothetical protein